MDGADTIMFSINDEPFGKTWKEWTIIWWRWVLSIPKDINPAFDPIGRNSARGQRGPVWFLAGTNGGSAERFVSIPSGKGLLFPVINFTTSFAEDRTLRTETELISSAKLNIDDIAYKGAVIDGMKLEDVEMNRIQTDVFEIEFPENNIYGLEKGPTKGASDGYWVFLKPPVPGEHEIRTFGSCLAGTIKINTTYHLNIE